MSDTKIKICGLRRPEDVICVNQVKPDYIGFIFAEGRKRTITPQQASALRTHLNPGIQTVGVFLDQSLQFIEDAARCSGIDLIQLHGHEIDDFVTQVKKQTRLPVIRAFSIADRSDIAAACRSSADYILLDNHLPGSGECFDWSLLKQIDRPYFLAGGLAPSNIADALTLQPFAVDVSSGVETGGYKDPQKIEEFAAIVRSYRKENIHE